MPGINMVYTMRAQANVVAAQDSQNKTANAYVPTVTE